MMVLFICSGNNYQGISPFIKSQGDSLIKLGVELEYFLIRGKGFAGYIKAVVKLRSWLKKNPMDLLHAHYGLCGWVTYLAKSKGIPLVLSYMGSDILPVKRGRVAPNALIARFCRALQNRVDHIIVKSNNLKDILSRKLGVSVIPNGIHLDHFRPIDKETCRKTLELPSDRKIVLFLGDPKDPRKNILGLKRAFEIERLTNLLLVTPFPIKFEHVPLYFNAADVLVVPSISEGSPNVVKEAMACNCPIVATDVGDIKWVIGDTAGCFLASFSSEDMANKIKSALDFKNRTTGRERIIELGLDSNSIANKIISVYVNVLKDTEDSAC